MKVPAYLKPESGPLGAHLRPGSTTRRRRLRRGFLLLWFVLLYTAFAIISSDSVGLYPNLLETYASVCIRPLATSTARRYSADGGRVVFAVSTHRLGFSPAGDGQCGDRALRNRPDRAPLLSPSRETDQLGPSQTRLRSEAKHNAVHLPVC
jgi:hypothetical protein